MPTLSTTNKHLRTADKRLKAIFRTVATSSAIEGIHAPFKASATAARKPANKVDASLNPTKIKLGRRAKSA